MFGIIVVGASWGGLKAVSCIVAGLPADFAIPIAIVQHRGRDGAGLLCDLLQERTPLRVTEVMDKEPVRPGHVYVAPPDYHTLVESGYFSLSTEAPVRYSRPSIDVTFASAADAYGAQAIGIVLTGANADGADGLKRIADRGGLVLVQDPAGAESGIMPRAALARVADAEVLALDAIAPFLARVAKA